MTKYRAAQPHGNITPVFDNIYMVTGTNSIHHEGVDIQASRNMTIVRENGNLTLINTVRLDDTGLLALEKLGTVKNVVRIGAFHGYDDAFYLDRYHAKLWAVDGMTHQSGHQTDVVLNSDTAMPLANCSMFRFKTTKFPESMLLLFRDTGNILISCDCIQNWTAIDPFFSPDTFEMFKAQGMIKPANIPSTWLGACKPDPEELLKIKTLSFKHLLSAHGEPLKNTAYEQVCATLDEMFKIPKGSL